MGKALIIKGADFSTNAIEGINLSGKRVFTQDNADGTYTGRVQVNGSGTHISFVTTASYTYKLYNVRANEILVIPRQTNNVELFFCDSLNTESNMDIPVAFSNLPKIQVNYASSTFQFASEKGVAIKGNKDYCVVVPVADNVNNIDYYFPDEIYVTQEYSPSRVLTEENYDSKITGKYINNSNHSWGNDSNGIYYFFNVFQGETVHIKANGTKGTYYGVFSQDIEMSTGTLPTAVFVDIDGEVEVPITELGRCICIRKQSENTINSFPEELYTYPTPASEPITE